MLQKGPNEPKNVPNGQKYVILTIWDHLGPFLTTSGHWQACHVRPFLVPNGPFLDARNPVKVPENGKKGVLNNSPLYEEGFGALGASFMHKCGEVTKKVKKWEKIAILWLFLSHRGCHMAPRLQKHEYLLVTKFLSEFEHFRMSGSIIT